MSNDQEPGRDKDSLPSWLDAFNAFMRRLPEFAYGWSVMTVGVIVGAVCGLATAP